MKIGGKSVCRLFRISIIMKWGETMQGTFDALIPPEQETVADPSVIPDTGNNMDLAAIVQRLDDLTAQVKQLLAVVGKNDSTETKTETETTETETETEEESEE